MDQKPRIRESHSEVMNESFMFLFCAAAVVTSLFLPPEVSVLFLVSAYSCMFYAIGIKLGNDPETGASRSISLFVGCLVVTHIVFSVGYWRFGLIANGKPSEISLWTAIYFSFTTWTTLGYGDFAPVPRIRHITSIQAIFGYVGLGIWVGLISANMQSLTNMRIRINKNNDELRERLAAEESETENNIDQAAVPSDGNSN